MILGVPDSNLHFLRLPDGALPRFGAVGFEQSCRRLADVMLQIEAQQIFTTGPFESWPDHLAAEELTRCALRESAFVADLYHYCVWFWIKVPLQRALRVDWSNACILDASEGRERKEQAIRTYLDDIAPCGNPYCGRLGKDFLRAVSCKRELFFRVPSEPARA
jgi:LmbE family N-acetylglucosaminyl deacetylase